MMWSHVPLQCSLPACICHIPYVIYAGNFHWVPNFVTSIVQFELRNLIPTKILNACNICCRRTKRLIWGTNLKSMEPPREFHDNDRLFCWQPSMKFVVLCDRCSVSVLFSSALSRAAPWQCCLGRCPFLVAGDLCVSMPRWQH